jgi:hypothetical protein
VQAHSSGRSELDVLDTEVGHLLDSGAGVIEEEQKRAIPERLGPVPRQRGKEAVDFIALEKARLGGATRFIGIAATRSATSSISGRRPARSSKKVWRQATR